MNKKTIKDIDIKGKKVFIRVDFNVPIKNGEIEDDTRIVGALPTIKYAVEQGAKVILASHLGRPLKDKKKAEEKGMPYDESKYSLKPVAKKLSELLGKPVHFEDAEDLNDAYSKVSAMENGEIVMLENLRLDVGEEANDDDFAKQLSQTLRCLRQRCFRHGASRTRFDGGNYKICRRFRRRTFDGKGIKFSRQSSE